jgi:hypothetical protein
LYYNYHEAPYKLGEVLSPLELIKKVIGLGKQVVVLNINLVKKLVIHGKFPLFLLPEYR